VLKLESVELDTRSAIKVDELLNEEFPDMLNSGDARGSLSLGVILDALNPNVLAPPAAAIICGLKGLEVLLAPLPFLECCMP